MRYDGWVADGIIKVLFVEREAAVDVDDGGFAVVSFVEEGVARPGCRNIAARGAHFFVGSSSLQRVSTVVPSLLLTGRKGV